MAEKGRERFLNINSEIEEHRLILLILQSIFFPELLSDLWSNMRVVPHVSQIFFEVIFLHSSSRGSLYEIPTCLPTNKLRKAQRKTQTVTKNVFFSKIPKAKRRVFFPLPVGGFSSNSAGRKVWRSPPCSLIPTMAVTALASCRGAKPGLSLDGLDGFRCLVSCLRLREWSQKPEFGCSFIHANRWFRYPSFDHTNL